MVGKLQNIQKITSKLDEIELLLKKYAQTNDLKERDVIRKEVENLYQSLADFMQFDQSDK